MIRRAVRTWIGFSLRDVGQVVAWVGLVSACSGAEVVAVQPTTATAEPSLAVTRAAPVLPPPDGDRRLSDDVVPRNYTLHFDIDPAATTFRGTTEIELQLAKPTKRFDLHGLGLSIQQVSFVQTDGRAVAARAELGENAGLSVHLEQEVAGGGRLRFEYSAGLDEIPESIYHVKDQQDWYVFTQFESQMAREAFPCFDEPKFKTPFAVTVTTPVGLTVVGNSPALERPVTPVLEGKQTVAFQPTKPLPTYLVALAIGPFESTAADLVGLGAGGGALPHKVYTVRGKQGLTSYATSVTSPILKSLVDYLGSPYPYEKLDQVAVPTFNAGAMENVGLVTYRENILLIDAVAASERDRAVTRSIMAHEFAHMWFGNLVTTQWWDDIWLNEAFATWMAAKVMTEIAPELETPVWSVSNMLDVMQQDALSTARPIRKVIAGSKDVQNAFDRITYQKGFAVLLMIENWIGPERFRKAIQNYLASHAWRNATMGDFVAALDGVTEEPVTAVSTAFIAQAGVPIVEVNTTCAKAEGGKSLLAVDLEQHRYAPLGAAPLPEAVNQVWSLPVCLGWIGVERKHAQQTCLVLDKPQTHVEVSLDQCPSAVYPNAAERGYYHVNLSTAELLDLTSRHWPKLRLEERVGLVKHALALFQGGQVDLATFASVLRNAAKDRHRLVVDAVIGGLWQLTRVASSHDERVAVQRFAVQLLSPHAKRLGVVAKPKESHADRLARGTVLAELGRQGPDATLKRTADQLAARFLGGATGLNLEQLQLLLPIAAARGDAAMHAALLERLKSATPGERVSVIDALGSFTDAKLLQASYNALLDGTVLPTERNPLLNGAAVSPERYAVFWEWYLANEAAFMIKAGKRITATLPGLAWMHCSAEGRDQATKHFADATRFGAASVTIWKEAAEGIDRCIAMRERFGGEVLSGLGGSSN